MVENDDNRVGLLMLTTHSHTYMYFSILTSERFVTHRVVKRLAASDARPSPKLRIKLCL